MDSPASPEGRCKRAGDKKEEADGDVGWESAAISE